MNEIILPLKYIKLGCKKESKEREKNSDQVVNKNNKRGQTDPKKLEWQIEDEWQEEIKKVRKKSYYNRNCDD